MPFIPNHSLSLTQNEYFKICSESMKIAMSIHVYVLIHLFLKNFVHIRGDNLNLIRLKGICNFIYCWYKISDPSSFVQNQCECVFYSWCVFQSLWRSLIPHVIQKKLYTFLRHGFDRWPLDCSFRLVSLGGGHISSSMFMNAQNLFRHFLQYIK